MTKRSKRPRLVGGFTLIELMLVVAILGILGSILAPRVDMMLQKAHQATTKGNLGSIRSSIALYYTDLEGAYPLAGYPNGEADSMGISLTGVICPRYMSSMPAPKLLERVGWFNGYNEIYDDFVVTCLASNPPKDVFILADTFGDTAGFHRPWMYDPSAGYLYLCNNNVDWAGSKHFYEW